MKNIIMVGLCLLVMFSACTDKTLDPLQFDQIKSGAIIALRGTAADNLDPANPISRKLKGAIDSFSISKAATEKFVFDVEFLSTNSSNLKSIEVYAKTDKIGRKKVTSIDGATLSVKTGSINPQGTVSIPITAILTALGAKKSDFAVGDFINIQCDLLLKDGGTVLSSSVVNSSLFESTIFFPAHDLLYIAGQ
jgi:hypothetical protein